MVQLKVRTYRRLERIMVKNMLTLLFIIFVGLFVLASEFIDEYDHEFFRIITQICTVIGAAISIICITFVCLCYADTIVIDEKIDMYLEENEKIENQIDNLVKNYMSYESDTYEKFKSNDAVTLVSLYPELKSDELVNRQITTYQNNNDKLKELKEQKINARVYRWWLFFGK